MGHGAALAFLSQKVDVGADSRRRAGYLGTVADDSSPAGTGDATSARIVRTFANTLAAEANSYGGAV